MNPDERRKPLDNSTQTDATAPAGRADSPRHRQSVDRAATFANDPDLLAQLAHIALHAARAGAEVVAQAAGTIGRTQVMTKSSHSDWVTEIDRRAEDVILAHIRAQRPHDRVLAEESASGVDQPNEASAAGAGSGAIEWVVDPLDGTVNFVYDYPAYAVAVGVRVGHTPLVGVVIDVARGETYEGRVGAPSTRNGRPIRCGQAANLADLLVGTGFNYRADWRTHQARVVADLLATVKDVRRSGSAALDLCHVADGRLDAFYEAGTQPWDWTAATAIARGAGAVVGGDGRATEPSRALVWACGPPVDSAFFDMLLQLSAPLSDLRP